MELKELGKTGIMIPEIGLGTWRYKGGAQPLRKGIELGAALIDTAEGYYTEEAVGEAISGIRDKVFIATKVSGRHLGYNDLLQSAEESLYKLGTDYIDLYQIHWPNPTYPIRETMQAMGELVDRGLVRFIGVSNFDIDEMEEAQFFLSHYPIVSNQVRYNLNDRSIEMDLLPYCEEKDITILAYTPLDDGNLAKKPSLINSNKMNILDDISQETGKTMGQVAINWCTSRKKVIAIPKSNSQERTIENCESSGWRLSPEEINRLSEAF
ncbi:MAG: aldo/keto reductase [Candidatus Dadabacteria bacterium]|nr:MAG: aldo/keto reductase [Candidatus Dadabacteria bacterium]TDI99517.1 MAG: aldo/keto reductase [Candidatus Dadabacteria bacterium]